MIAKAELDLSDVLNMVSGFRREANNAMNEAVSDVCDQFQARVRSTSLSKKGDDSVDSRQLRKALWTESRRVSGGIMGRVYFRGHWEPVARIHEHGTTGKGGTMPPIRPKRVKWLTIPLKGAYKGQSRGKALRAIRQHNTFFARSKKGNLLMFRKLGKNKVEPIFLLVKKVELPPRLGFYRKWNEWMKKSGPGWKIIEAGASRAVNRTMGL